MTSPAGQTTAVSPVNANALVDPPKPSAAWGDVHWKPFEIGVGAFYALCLKGGFDTTLTYYRSSHVDLHELLHNASAFNREAAISCQLVTFVIWLSAYYFHTVRLYFRLPEDDRAIGFANLAIILGLFYFLGETIGRPARSQVILICAVLVADMLLPIQALKSVATAKMRIYWIVSALAVLFGAIAFIVVLPDRITSQYWLSYVILVLISINFFVLRPRAAARGLVYT